MNFRCVCETVGQVRRAALARNGAPAQERTRAHWAPVRPAQAVTVAGGARSRLSNIGISGSNSVPSIEGQSTALFPSSMAR